MNEFDAAVGGIVRLQWRAISRSAFHLRAKMASSAISPKRLQRHVRQSWQPSMMVRMFTALATISATHHTRISGRIRNPEAECQ
jgi:hypothetical protein